MNTKTLSLFSVGILTLLVCIAFVSAATTFTVSPSSVSFGLEDNSKTITVTNTNSSVLLDISVGSLSIDGTVFTVTGNKTNINTSTVLTIEPVGDIDFSAYDVGEDLSAVLTITDTNNPTEKADVAVSISTSEFCDYENDGNDLKVKIDNVDNEGIGSNDVWFPLDNIKVDVEVENKGNDDIDDISLEWGLYSKKTDSWVIDYDEEDTFDLTDDDQDTFTIEFDLDDDLNIDYDELEDGDYVLYVRATGTVDKSGSPLSCGEDSEEVEIRIEKHYVVLSDFKVVGSTFCGSQVQLTADIWNLGSKEQEDVRIDVYNTELGIDEEILISSIDEFNDRKLNLEFTIPEGAEEKTYHITLEVYDEDGDIYDSEKESRFTVPISVSGNCRTTPAVRTLASLESGGKAGEEMEVKATITNEASSSQTYTVKLGDYSSWSELVSIEPATITLSSGQSTDVMITLNVDSDADATETFNILVEDSKGGVASQPIEVSIDSGFSLSGIFSGKGYIWGIAILNIVLVLIIIIIAVKVARR